MTSVACDRFQVGAIHADCVTFAGAIDAIADLVRAGAGGYVVTPNVDHVVLAERSSPLRTAYAGASLSLADGTPLVWLSRLLHPRLPEKVSGSDLTVPLLKRAAREGWRVYLLGGEPGVGQAAAARLTHDIPNLEIVGTDAPALGFDKDPGRERAAFDLMCEAKADLVLMALGCPKQEILMQRWHSALALGVMLGVGATLDFLAGHVRRAPACLSRWGLEWLYRLAQDPRRLARRYLVRDLAFIPIVLRTWLNRLSAGRPTELDRRDPRPQGNTADDLLGADDLRDSARRIQRSRAESDTEHDDVHRPSELRRFRVREQGVDREDDAVVRG